MTRYFLIAALVGMFGVGASFAVGEESEVKGEAATALRKAVAFYRGRFRMRGRIFINTVRI